MIAKTSTEAYHDLLREGQLGRRQKEVLALVRANPGYTAMELSRIAGYSDPNRIRPRLHELAAAGHIETAGNRLCTVTDRMAMTWRLKRSQAQGELF